MPIHSCVGAIANRGQWKQGCSLFMATDLGPARATCRKKILSGEGLIVPIFILQNPPAIALAGV